MCPLGLIIFSGVLPETGSKLLRHASTWHVWPHACFYRYIQGEFGVAPSIRVYFRFSCLGSECAELDPALREVSYGRRRAARPQPLDREDYRAARLT